MRLVSFGKYSVVTISGFHIDLLKCQIEGTPVTVGVGSGLASPGYSFMLSTDTAGIVWEAILNAGAVPMGAAAWEQLRVWQGEFYPVNLQFLCHHGYL